MNQVPQLVGTTQIYSGCWNSLGGRPGRHHSLPHPDRKQAQSQGCGPGRLPSPAAAQAALFNTSGLRVPPAAGSPPQHTQISEPGERRPFSAPPAPPGGANAALRCSQGGGWKFEPLLGEELDLRRVTWRLPPELIPRLSAGSRLSSDSGPPGDGAADGGARGAGGEGGDRHAPTRTHLSSSQSPPQPGWLARGPQSRGTPGRRVGSPQGGADCRGCEAPAEVGSVGGLLLGQGTCVPEACGGGGPWTPPGASVPGGQREAGCFDARGPPEGR